MSYYLQGFKHVGAGFLPSSIGSLSFMVIFHEKPWWWESKRFGKPRRLKGNNYWWFHSGHIARGRFLRLEKKTCFPFVSHFDLVILVGEPFMENSKFPWVRNFGGFIHFWKIWYGFIYCCSILYRFFTDTYWGSLTNRIKHEQTSHA